MSKLVEVARQDLGQREKKGNSGFLDRQLERDLVEIGWSKGLAWCAFIVEKWAKQAMPRKYEQINHLFSGSAVATFNNFRKAGYKISKTPVVGSIVIWQKYNDGVPHWSGHAGVVSEVISDTEFKSIEGNTNETGSREGDRVAEKRRRITKPETGLRVIGFIVIEDVSA